jgi:hypothetical protein
VYESLFCRQGNGRAHRRNHTKSARRTSIGLGREDLDLATVKKLFRSLCLCGNACLARTVAAAGAVPRQMSKANPCGGQFS